MSELTTLFTNLANKIRSKTGKNGLLTPNQMVTEIDAVYSKAVSETKVGTAEAGDVTTGKTFTNASNTGVSGTMPDYRNVTSPTVQNGSSDSSKPGFRLNGDNYEVAPMAGRWGFDFNHCIKIPAQVKSASSGTSAQSITPDAGKVLKGVTISAISPQKTNGINASAVSRDANGPCCYFPYGWYPNNNNSGDGYVRMSDAQLNAAVNSQTKTVTASRENQTVTPDNGKLLSSVTVNKYPDANGTYITSTRNASIDMGASNNYRYVSTTNVPNNNTEKYTLASNEKGIKDLGATNNYRYIDATNVYNQGKADGKPANNVQLWFNCEAAYSQYEFWSWMSNYSKITLVFYGDSPSFEIWNYNYPAGSSKAMTVARETPVDITGSLREAFAVVPTAGICRFWFSATFKY